MNKQANLTPELERFRAGLYPEVMHGLPREAYLDEGYMRRESERLFARHWVFVAYAHELAEPGDLRPIAVAGQPVLLLRGRDGAIRAFHNVCSHRGAKLVESECAGKRNIVCPYHAWCYDLEGRLTATPHFGGYRKDAAGFDKAAHGLKPIASAVFHDWIFVNLDGKAPAFADYAAPLQAAMVGLDFSNLRPVAKIDLGVVKANWKFLMENFIEPYHVPIVHRSTTEQPLDEHYNIVNGLCLGSAVDIARVPSNGERADTLAVSSRYLTLFPNFVMGVYAPDQLGVHLNLPLAPGETQQYRVIYQFAGEPWSETQVAALRQLWYRVHKEDHAILERLQAGRQSSATADGGLLSPYWETSLYEFQRLVRDSLE